MKSPIKTLSNSQKRDFLILGFLTVLISVFFIAASLFIKVLHHDRAYFPTGLDYLRIIILSPITSLVVNCLSRYVNKYLILIKVWISFLSLLLLSYPQKTQDFNILSEWNLVMREASLFGVFYEIVSLVFYFYDQVLIAANDCNALKVALEPDHEENSIHELVRQRSTLEKCLQIRKHSNNLRKILYPESYGINTINTSAAKTDHLEDLLITNKNDSPSRYSATDNITQPSTSSSLESSSSHFPNNLNSVSPVSLITGLVSIRKSHNVLRYRLQWYVDHCVWIISQFLYEMGISLILSIAFIYVPNTDDSKFSPLEKYYYNNLKEFALEIILPLFIIVSALQLSVIHIASRQLGAHPSTWAVIATFWAQVCVSVVLFTFGIIFG